MKLIREPMICAIKESKRQDKQQNQMKTASITYNQNSMSIHLKKNLMKKSKCFQIEIFKWHHLYLHAKQFKACHYPECHMTTKRTNTGKNKEVVSILRGNGVEAYKIKTYSLDILNIISCH